MGYLVKMLLKIEIVSHDLTLLLRGKSLRWCYWRACSYKAMTATEEYAQSFWNSSNISVSREANLLVHPTCCLQPHCRPHPLLSRAFSLSPHAFNQPTVPSAALHPPTIYHHHVSNLQVQDVTSSPSLVWRDLGPVAWRMVPWFPCCSSSSPMLLIESLFPN